MHPQNSVSPTREVTDPTAICRVALTTPSLLTACVPLPLEILCKIEMTVVPTSEGGREA